MAPWSSFNLGDHVGDDPAHVLANRASLRPYLPSEPLWLKQVHGIAAIDAGSFPRSVEGDAAFTRRTNTVCTVMTADCLPVLFCDRSGTVVAAAHAGWRGLVAGVLEATIKNMAVSAGELLVWLGPAIGPGCFEVGDEVRAAFLSDDPEATEAFVPSLAGKWLADIYALARRRLQRTGVESIYGGGACTVKEHERFFSYRRDGVTGRMATLIWLAADGV
ncbi:MAG: hypothetical protein H6R13_542 [Proteobacteria bacterium]|nr:hypothetical protein [Pseudomonadota bacterium]